MEVKDPSIKNADDIIVKITTSAICGSDLHLIHAMIPNLPIDYVIGHEPMGIVEEVGPEAKHGYEVFDKKMEDCIKVILKP